MIMGLIRIVFMVIQIGQGKPLPFLSYSIVACQFSFHFSFPSLNFPGRELLPGAPDRTIDEAFHLQAPKFHYRSIQPVVRT